jgi:hypothetical protein
MCLTFQPKLLVAQDKVPETFAQGIERIFSDKTEIAKAVFFHESNNKLDAINYNCIYTKYDEDGKPIQYSTSCKKGDESKAWSVDCGAGQINVRAKTCPEELFTVEGTLVAIERIYKTQGLNAWVSYKTGRYKKYL